MSALLVCCGGFLLAVLWMDLIFDVQVLRFPDQPVLPQETLASISAYYRRATTEAYPMNRLIAVVMLIAVGGSFAQLFVGSQPRWIGGASLVLCGVPVLLARFRVIPSAVRLGTRRDASRVQSELARAICRDHLFCLGSIAFFIGIQMAAPWLP